MSVERDFYETHDCKKMEWYQAHLKEDAERGQSWDAGYEKGWADGKKRGEAELTRMDREHSAALAEVLRLESELAELREAVRDVLPYVDYENEADEGSRMDLAANRLRQLIEENK